MKSYLTNIAINLRLTFRDRMAIAFGYAFPLIFFFLFGQLYDAGQGGGVARQVVASVLIIGVLGNGFFGAGMRAVQEREMGILRRYKVAPTTAAPLLVSSLITGWISYLPAAAAMVALAHYVYGMPWPEKPLTLFFFISSGIFAFRAVGLIIASVVNSMQESQIVIQMLYLPMLFLSGATFPIAMLPKWLQIVSQFLPASHLFAGLQGILIRQESLAQQTKSLIALLLTAAIALLLGVKLFRWEKEEKVRGTAKLWLAAALAPFLVMGVYQAYSEESLHKAKTLDRANRRSRNLLIRNARIFVGDGKVIESGAVLVREGKIVEVYQGTAPDEKTLRADPIEGAGKTLLPGLIDVHVHLGAPGGVVEDYSKYDFAKAISRELQAYLFSGVTAVRSVGDSLTQMKKARADVESGEVLGAELLYCGPMFTTRDGHGTEYTKYVPETIRATIEKELVRLPANVAEARAQVDELASQGVDGIKIILESGAGKYKFERMDTELARAVASEAHGKRLPVSVHTGDVRDMNDAISMGASSIEHGSMREDVADATWQAMLSKGIYLDPTLTVIDLLASTAKHDFRFLDRSLVQQVAPPGLIAATKKALGKQSSGAFESANIAVQNFKAALAAGVRMVAGTDSGNPGVVHGPMIHREMQLYVQAGAAPALALQAATGDAAKLLGIEARAGYVRKGLDANLLLVDGNPLEDIGATERISMVIFRGERVARSGLLKND